MAAHRYRWRGAARPLAKPVEAAPVMTALSYDEEPKAFPAPPRPRLIASRPNPMGNVAIILADIMEPGRGRVEIADVFEAYSAACQASGKRPIPANEFPAVIAALCERLGIQIEDTESGVFLLKVKIRKTAKAEAGRGK